MITSRWGLILYGLPANGIPPDERIGPTDRTRSENGGAFRPSRRVNVNRSFFFTFCRHSFFFLKESCRGIVKYPTKMKTKTKHSFRWWQLKYFLFSPLFGEMIQFDEHIFQMGWNHPPVIQFHISPPAFVHPLHSSFLCHWNPPGGAPVRGLKKRGWIATPLKKWRAGT